MFKVYIRQWRRSSVFIDNFGHISHPLLVFANFEEVNADWMNISGMVPQKPINHTQGRSH